MLSAIRMLRYSCSREPYHVHVHCYLSVMVFQQLILSYNTSVSGDHHVTTWADGNIVTALYNLLIHHVMFSPSNINYPHPLSSPAIFAWWHFVRLIQASSEKCLSGRMLITSVMTQGWVISSHVIVSCMHRRSPSYYHCLCIVHATICHT